MKITVQDVGMVNWEAVADKIKADAIQKVVDGLEEAQKHLATLKAGQRKTIVIKLGSITISKPKE